MDCWAPNPATRSLSRLQNGIGKPRRWRRRKTCISFRTKQELVTSHLFSSCGGAGRFSLPLHILSMSIPHLRQSLDHNSVLSTRPPSIAHSSHHPIVPARMEQTNRDVQSWISHLAFRISHLMGLYNIDLRVRCDFL